MCATFFRPEILMGQRVKKLVRVRGSVNFGGKHSGGIILCTGHLPLGPALPPKAVVSRQVVKNHTVPEFAIVDGADVDGALRTPWKTTLRFPTAPTLCPPRQSP